MGAERLSPHIFMPAALKSLLLFSIKTGAIESFKEEGWKSFTTPTTGPTAKPFQRFISLFRISLGLENPSLLTRVSFTRNSLMESVVVIFLPATRGREYVLRYFDYTYLSIAAQSVTFAEWSIFNPVLLSKSSAV